MKAKYSRKIIAVRGDTQGGHRGGLRNPGTQFPVFSFDKKLGVRVVKRWETEPLNEVQSQLWKWHEADRLEIQKLAGTDPISFVEMGDVTQGNRYTDDLRDVSLSRQFLIAKWNMLPWLDMPEVKAACLVKGTGVHEWGEGSTAAILCDLLQGLYPKKRIEMAPHYMLNIDGFLIDVAHHGPGAGIHNWTRANVFHLYCKSILMDDLDLRLPVPSALLRGHRHEFVYARPYHQVGANVWEFPAWVLPSYCYIDSHAEKVAQSPSRMSIGMLALEIVNGKLQGWYPFVHIVDLRMEMEL